MLLRARCWLNWAPSAELLEAGSIAKPCTYSLLDETGRVMNRGVGWAKKAFVKVGVAKITGN